MVNYPPTFLITNYDIASELNAVSAENARLRDQIIESGNLAQKFAEQCERLEPEVERLRVIIEQALAHLGDQSMARCDRITWAVRTLQQVDPNGPQGTD